MSDPLRHPRRPWEIDVLLDAGVVLVCVMAVGIAIHLVGHFVFG